MMRTTPLRSHLWHTAALSVLFVAGGQAIAAEPMPSHETAPAEEALARKPLEAYLQGHATGDGSHMRRAFLPSAHIEGMRNGKFSAWTLDEYVANFTGQPAADEAQRSRRIDTIDISGSAAMARATLEFPKTTVTDYFVLLKVDGEWKIANKVYSVKPK